MKEEDVWREEEKGAGDKAPLSSEKKEKKEKKLSSFLLRVGSGIVLLLLFIGFSIYVMRSEKFFKSSQKKHSAE